MGKFCIHCAKKGMKMKLKPYLINFEEAVLFCTNEECNNTDGFRVVKLQQLVFKPKQKKLKVGITHAGKTLENQNDNVEFQYEIKSTENVVLKSVDTELDDILFGLTNNNNDPVTLDNDDLDLLGFGNINLSQPVEKTTEEVVNPNNLEDLGLGNNPSLNSTIQPVEKDSKEAFKADDLNFLTFDNVALFNTPSAEVEKASDECFKYPLWKNENNLCWLHAMMCVFVHNNSIRNYVFGSMRNSCLNKLILGYDECVALLNSEAELGGLRQSLVCIMGFGFQGKNLQLTL